MYLFHPMVLGDEWDHDYRALFRLNQQIKAEAIQDLYGTKPLKFGYNTDGGYDGEGGFFDIKFDKPIFPDFSKSTFSVYEGVGSGKSHAQLHPGWAKHITKLEFDTRGFYYPDFAEESMGVLRSSLTFSRKIHPHVPAASPSSWTRAGATVQSIGYISTSSNCSKGLQASRTPSSK